MDLLAAYDSGSEADEVAEFCAVYPKGIGHSSNRAAALQIPPDFADQDHAPQNKRARLSNGSDRDGMDEVPVAPAAAGQTATAQGAAGALFTLPAEPERVRCFPLVEGLFPTVVFVPVPEAVTQQLHALAATLVAACIASELASNCNRNQQSGLVSGSCSKLLLWPTCPSANSSCTSSNAATDCITNPQQQQQQQPDAAGEGGTPPHTLPLHLSLSQTVPIRYGQAASLKAALEKQLRPCRKFTLQLSGLVCLTNEPRTRTFVSLRVATGLQQVLRMIGQVDAAFTLHGLPKFHENPVPHVSLAWAPGDQTQVLQQWLDSFDHLPVALAVSQAVCQVGRFKHAVWEA